MNTASLQHSLDDIVASIKQAGYDPYAQLTGYLQTGEAFYITRHGNAREKIVLIDKEYIRQYIRENLEFHQRD